MIALGGTTVFAGPNEALIYRACRDIESPVFLGAPNRDMLTLARCIDWSDPPSELRVVEKDLEIELAALSAPDTLAWGSTIHGRLALGPMVEPYQRGDVEPGWLSPRASMNFRGFYRGFGLRIRPEIGLDVGAETNVPWMAFREMWFGSHHSIAQTGQIFSSAGLRDRWLGPGRRGSLLLTNHALPAPMVSLGANGAPKEWAQFRVEMGAGWLNRERTDVERPGWLFFDARWIPFRGLELGASRMSIFGGEGRPSPKLGQLILPTDPHVYDDPDGLLPDQDELAALDARWTLPLDRWIGQAELRYLELWWQYGAEDLMVVETAGIAYPSLAGIANLYGVELAISNLVLAFEGARIFDDYFRWYTGHRIYHEGFTREGLSMGHWVGGDAMTGWLSLTWMQPDTGVEVWGEQITRIGVVERVDDRLVTLLTEEERLRIGIRGWKARPTGGWWRIGLSVEQIVGENFVPGADGWTWRVGLEG